jgi:hypothetical protein
MASHDFEVLELRDHDHLLSRANVNLSPVLRSTNQRHDHGATTTVYLRFSRTLIRSWSSLFCS